MKKIESSERRAKRKERRARARARQRERESESESESESKRHDRMGAQNTKQTILPARHQRSSRMAAVMPSSVIGCIRFSKISWIIPMEWV